jgi:subtilase family serine protease
MRQRRAATVAIRAAGVALAVAVAAGAAGLAAGATGLAAIRGVARSHPPTLVRVYPQVRVLRPVPAAVPNVGYTPAQIRAAYFVRPLLRAGITGKGQSIAIVDSFGSPTIRHDLAVFDRTFRLPAPPALLIIHPAGRIPRFNPNNATMTGWAFETTLDVEWAHVMAPGARIVLVETPVSENEGTSGFPQIEKAEKYVISHHLAGVISQSFGATEETFPKGTLRPLRGAYLLAARPANDVTVVSASGDAGATDLKTNMNDCYLRRVTSWPASDPLVTSVGGLDLKLDSRGRRNRPDRVWNDGDPSATCAAGGAAAGGGGLSVDFGRPGYQNGVKSSVGSHRGVPDIALSASCMHSVEVYSSFAGAGWSPICGTSEATPLFAGLIALADQVAREPIGPINGFLYRMAAARDPGIVDITRGTNTVSFQQGGKSHTVVGWSAVRGYDLASGLGSVNARLFVPELAALARRARR